MANGPAAPAGSPSGVRVKLGSFLVVVPCPMFLPLFVSLHGAGHGSVLQLLVRFVKHQSSFLVETGAGVLQRKLQDS
tara:strand:+ start:8607 stop:8837 length:231 start_codon:yes stop_codon:yes gene_type:complete